MHAPPQRLPGQENEPPAIVAAAVLSHTSFLDHHHLHALREFEAHLAQASALLGARNPALDLLAEELRLAQNALNTITGEFGADELLGVIFSKFCIGK